MKSRAQLDFFEYHVWSYKELLTHLQGLPGDPLSIKFVSGFPTIGSVLQHVLETDTYWYSIISGAPKVGAKKLVDIDEYRQHFAEIHDRYKDYLTKITDYDKEIEFTSRSGTEMRNAIGEILLTVVNHGSYHRGNISSMLRQIGLQSTSMDYAFYLRRIRSGR